MLMRQPTGNLQFTYQPPFGATVQDGGVQFSVFSRSATAMRLLLYNKVNDPEPADIIEFDRDTDRWGDVWSLSVQGLNPGQLYHFQASGPWDPENGQRFDSAARLIDPYAQALAGTFQKGDDGVVRPPKCVVVQDDFDWEDDRHVRRDLSESIIYEMHVRGFTRSRTAKVKCPGTYLGVIEKIPYLKELGVTAVELMPVNEFPILDIWGNSPERPNYWGYDPMAFFSPHRGYAHDKRPGAQVNEFKTMVKALHAAGIEVILDVVFNHTCEGNENGPTLSFKGLENQVYYILSEGKHYSNYSGCGNTINGNHPVVREMIFHCLRHWVHNYHIDGFRFDLASILSRDRGGNLIPNPPMVELIAEDPLLADTKIIAEAWDAAGAYQVGSFGNHRWAEWNGRYRDDIRGFWRGDGGTLGALATRLAGSSDLYQHAGRPPFCSINFITSHDGFTLNDLVSYKDKHNMANGEDNRDGDNHNISDNYGVEGPTRRKGVNTIRARQVRNMLATLLLSQGVPMLVSGDEIRRTQRGNNNAYCQDNDISWFDWRLVEKNAEVLRFVKALTQFRKNQPTVRRTSFLTGQPVDGRLISDVSWYSDDGHPLDWNQHHLSMVAYIAAPSRVEDPTGQGRDMVMMFNSTGDDRIQHLPEVGRGMKWNLFIDTAAESPGDIYPDIDGPMPPSNRQVSVPCHSLKVFVSGRVSNRRRK
ncbi:glycogen debranching protein GlgX [Roseiconus lacunae]|uniref:Glycogen debranching protein GlgX n=1 Tax=Roseiconus lacunae TaxID=2605694 RepID=A0ABT7PRN2_9BACT|nr:glycogen debranching protein GlgX [Roseiconus lacunae]MCD0459189.1 glycogen debranching protein GlgX [Roseiconus lacunae]MDM4019001.1 glycogen debranching protein GlgX [Roseiconus lacunae]WRQ51805.1 glycogen debranching protein GlgX [Stieleria sp. HD01]